ncbi:MAG: ProQ/FINO family protein [Candidatus Competibacterales bacterium]|nr:ProQ/FINO family protein [Candidatus Competibacterales bacterium]
MAKHSKTVTITLTRPVPPSVKAALQALRETFPAAFPTPPVPLPEGLLPTAHEALADTHSKKSVRRALVLWCNQTDYLRAVVAEEARLVNLDGSDAGPVSEELREAAHRRLATRSTRPTAPEESESKPPPPSRERGEKGQAAPSAPDVRIRRRPKLVRSQSKSDQRPTLSLRKPASKS